MSAVLRGIERDLDARWESERLRARQMWRNARRAVAAKFARHSGYWSLLSWLSEGFTKEDAPPKLLLIDEAIPALRKKVRLQRNLLRSRRYATFDASALDGALQRLVLARYFRRYGKRIWKGTSE